MPIQAPLARREVGRLAAQRSIYLVRALGPLIALVGLAITVFSADELLELFVPTQTFTGAGLGPAASMNLLLFLGTQYQLGIVLVVAPLLAAVALAEEKQARTLPLLVLTAFRPREIVLTKFAAAAAQSLVLLLAVIPIWGFAVFFGGVTVGQIVTLSAVFAAHAIAGCAVGICVAAVADRTFEAMLGAAAVMGVWTGLAYNLDYAALAPSIAFSLVTAVESLSRSVAAGLGWIAPMVFAFVMTPVLLTAAVYAMPRALEGRVTAQGAGRSRRNRWLPWNRPVARVANALSTGMRERVGSPVYVFVVAVVLAGIAMVPVFGWLVVLGIMLYDITAPIARAHQSGAWQDLLTTPLSDRALLRAVIAGQIRRALVFLPALMVAGTPALLMVLLIQDLMPSATLSQRIIEFITTYNGIPILAIYILIHLGQGLFVVSLGTYLGVLGQHPLKQTLRAILLFGAVYGVLTVFGREFANAWSDWGIVGMPWGPERDAALYLNYAFVLAVVYLIPYAGMTAAIFVHLSRHLREFMTIGQPERRAGSILTTPIRLPQRHQA